MHPSAECLGQENNKSQHVGAIGNDTVNVFYLTTLYVPLKKLL